jgi:hypothetical protein
MVGVLAIQPMQGFEAVKEGPPSTSKLRSHFYPQALDARVVG